MYMPPLTQRTLPCPPRHGGVFAVLLAWVTSAAFGLEPLPDTRLAALPVVSAQSNASAQGRAIIELGRLLFFDPLLSATRDTACATCHHPRYGWADGRSTPLGAHSQGLGPERRMTPSHIFPPLPRNTPTILNVAFNGIQTGQTYQPATAPMFWDNRVLSLEAQALSPIRSREEMRGDACTEPQAVTQMVGRIAAVQAYRNLFALAFKNDVSAERVALSLATFQRTLIAPTTPFDCFMRGDSAAMTPLQQRGMQAFQRAGCALCHNGPMLSDYKLHALGVIDATTTRQDFRTPTLRQLPHTAPYMHNGSFKTLEDVLQFYDLMMDAVSETQDGADQNHPPLDPLLRHLNLQPEDHEPILAFLQALSSDDYDRSVPKAVPSGLPPASQNIDPSPAIK